MCEYLVQKNLMDHLSGKHWKLVCCSGWIKSYFFRTETRVYKLFNNNVIVDDIFFTTGNGNSIKINKYDVQKCVRRQFNLFNHVDIFQFFPVQKHFNPNVCSELFPKQTHNNKKTAELTNSNKGKNKTTFLRPFFAILMNSFFSNIYTPFKTVQKDCTVFFDH